MPTCLNCKTDYVECRVLMKQHDSFGFSIREVCYQDWLEGGGGARAWHSLSPKESGVPDCNMLGIHPYAASVRDNLLPVCHDVQHSALRVCVDLCFSLIMYEFCTKF